MGLRSQHSPTAHKRSDLRTEQRSFIILIISLSMITAAAPSLACAYLRRLEPAGCEQPIALQDLRVTLLGRRLRKGSSARAAAQPLGSFANVLQCTRGRVRWAVDAGDWRARAASGDIAQQ